MAFNAADPTHISHRKSRQRREAKELQRAVREVLKTHEGRLMCWSLLSSARVFANVFDPDPMLMAFRTAQQEFGRKVQAQLLDANEEAYDLMTREARARGKQEAALEAALWGEEDDDDRSSRPDDYDAD